MYNVIEPAFLIDDLPGVGPKTKERLNSIQIFNANDVVFKIPNSYMSHIPVNLNLVEIEETITAQGTVKTEPSVTYMRRGMNRLVFFMEANDIYLKVTFFNQPYLRDKIKVNQTVKVHGKFNKLKQEMSGKKLILGSKEDMEIRYALNKAMHNRTFKNLVSETFKHAQFKYDIPTELREKYHLMPISDALYLLHFPQSFKDVSRARRTLKFYELFMYQVKIMEKRRAERVRDANSIVPYDIDKLKAFIQTLPFELTNDQKTSVNSICRDLLSEYSMHRLLQGDVGSGKTIVAGICVYAAKTARVQSALMVPTEVLANQHFESLSETFSGELNLALLTGSTTKKEKCEILNQLKNGNMDLIIGTHALIEDDVVFKNLGFIITDEQHRFGVNQREKLNEKARHKNVLYMTATPIPRTLSITTFGDMDVSIIKTMPAGRKSIETTWRRSNELSEVMSFIRSEHNRGHSIYVVAPLIEESETLDLITVNEIYELFLREFGSEEVVLVHGKMKNDEKVKAMDTFETLKKRILVSTTVIEVGINVPNATVMVIFNAERFGLSTLHQLRGRVGRSDKQSYCILISDPKTEQAAERMNIMTETTDGFILSERDLEMRGPGDFFGVRQSGLPEFKAADLAEDYKMLEIARDEAIQLFKR
ncbi:ATP-dependent DNA helicase RecG [Phocicoccus pinnipedialis]|uniref:ATP-dependent DNA helicase RecG n=1 Tax=Phocicoccus pinnipedialis TaxID=110845 RepID=A0A6V7RIB5_9BACL|nr:ATP-dependent DNA helicase RecG [Jeotgalicoccus pinnipedialis]MBP1939082.1 ATP-dependent DNA helicase RecG [Jeotgalicoccus pinnipedialis]CAD2076881.1 ATP-dependent DNA helicase RecG [Jeotgalicoccus pinnipedialis]